METGNDVKTCLGAGLGDSTKVVDHVGLGHTNTGIPETKEFVLLVDTDTDVEFLFTVENRGVGQGCVADFVESIGTVGNQFPQEDFLVRVKGVYEGQG